MSLHWIIGGPTGVPEALWEVGRGQRLTKNLLLTPSRRAQELFRSILSLEYSMNSISSGLFKDTWDKWIYLSPLVIFAPWWQIGRLTFCCIDSQNETDDSHHNSTLGEPREYEFDPLESQ